MTLNNKLGLNGEIELAREEERLSKKRALELFKSGKFDRLKPGTVDSLQSIHKYLFQDVYDFAGRIRNVNLIKGSFRFAPVLYLNSALERIEQMPQSTFDEIVEKYVEMNVAHPFREGNGRSTRIWLDQIFKSSLGQVIDWSRINKEDYLLAMERSPIRDTEIKLLLKKALTSDINDRVIYAKGIDASYAYEGYSTFRSKDLE